jgi:hypothetical protein
MYQAHGVGPEDLLFFFSKYFSVTLYLYLYSDMFIFYVVKYFHIFAYFNMFYIDSLLLLRVNWMVFAKSEIDVSHLCNNIEHKSGGLVYIKC